MKKLLIIKISLISSLTFAQSKFYKDVKGLEEIHYSVVQAKKPVNTTPRQNWYNERVKLITSHGTLKLDTINANGIKKIEVYFIKGKKEILPKTYGRARLEQWTIKDSLEAKKIIKSLSTLNLEYTERICKSPWTFWQKENKIYFIITGGTYMMDELSKIKSTLNKRIKNGD